MGFVSAAVLSEVNRILDAIRTTLDISATSPREARQNFHQRRDAYLRFEDVRIEFQEKALRHRNGNADTGDEPFFFLKDALSGLLSDKNFSDALGALTYRPPAGEQKNLIHPVFSDQIPLPLALSVLRDEISSIPGQENFEHADGEGGGRNFRKIIPAHQFIAPVQFDIVDGKIVIAPQRAIADRADKDNIFSARLELHSSGQKIIDQLNSSNCDRRLLDTVLDIQNKLSSENDVIRLGLANIGCGEICEKFSNELPVALSAMLKAHTIGIGMFVAQFPEWQRFTEQAASIHLTQNDAPTVSLAAQKIIENLSARPDISDEEVPRTLKALNNLLQDPQLSTKKAIYAVWRSIENIAIKIFSYGADFLDKTASKSVDTLSGVASKAIVVALMTVALAGATTLAPLAPNVPESAWISQAIKAAKEQLSKLD